jgi:hypothetical protein
VRAQHFHNDDSAENADDLQQQPRREHLVAIAIGTTTGQYIARHTNLWEGLIAGIGIFFIVYLFENGGKK